MADRIWVPVMRRAFIVAVTLLLVSAAPASALVCTVEYAGARAQVVDPFRFEAIIGYPGQCVNGIPCWQYTKGTRSPVANYPESWYLHVSGRRVRDTTWGFYVMDPLSSGWRVHVAQSCAHLCFIDGMGASGLGRMRPRPAISASKWESELALIVKAVASSGKQVLPNSVGSQSLALIAAAGQGSTESYTASNARQLLGLGRIWVTERGNCLTKYTAYRRYAGRGDHFSCYEPPRKPWDTGWLR